MSIGYVQTFVRSRKVAITTKLLLFWGEGGLTQWVHLVTWIIVLVGGVGQRVQQLYSHMSQNDGSTHRFGSASSGRKDTESRVPGDEREYVA